MTEEYTFHNNIDDFKRLLFHNANVNSTLIPGVGQKVAALRIETKGEFGSDLNHLLCEVHQTLVEYYSNEYSKRRNASQNEEENEIMDYKLFSLLKNLNEALIVHYTLSKIDSIFTEEILRKGSYSTCKRIIKLSTSIIEESTTDTSTMMIMEEETQLQSLTINVKIYDLWNEINDYACACIASLNKNIQSSSTPFSPEEIIQRLPLIFPIQLMDSTETVAHDDIYIQQVQDRQQAQEDVGFVMWPSALLLTPWVQHKYFNEKYSSVTLSSSSSYFTILELGAGCGFSGLALAKHLESEKMSSSSERSYRIIITDYNTKVLSNIQQNIVLNGFSESNIENQLDLHHDASAMKLDDNIDRSQEDAVYLEVKTAKLDFYEQDGYHEYSSENNNSDKIKADLIIGADIICKKDDAVAAAKTLHDFLKADGQAFIVCGSSKHRFGIDIFADECTKQNLMCDVHKLRLNSEVNQYHKIKNDSTDDDINDSMSTFFSSQQFYDFILPQLKLTSGYVEGMDLLFFHIRKK